MSTSTTQRIWLKGRPPGPQMAYAGESWQFLLPLIGFDSTPACRFSSDLFNQCQPAPNTNPLALTVRLPPDIRPGIYTISYTVEMDPPVEGHFLLKILASRTKAEKLEKTDDVPKIAPEIPESPNRLDQNTSDEFISEKIPERKSGLDQLLRMYQISVWRGNTPIPQLTRNLDRQKSILVGKTSISKGIIPDIDLKDFFATREDAKLCSRSQARIYWLEDRVVLENLGKSPLRGPGDSEIVSGQRHDDWKPNQRFDLPGGISLVLETII